MTFHRDRVLSEFMDAWNAGQRPDVDAVISGAPDAERAELADALISFLAVAPTPSYSNDALEAIRADPIVADALAAAGTRGGLLPALLRTLRERYAVTTAQLAAELVPMLGLASDREAKTASYLDRLEQGELEPSRISRRVLDALSGLLAIPRGQLEGAGDLSGWGGRPAMASGPLFRADEDASPSLAHHLEVFADATDVPGGESRDEVDDLFLGGR